MTLRAAYSAGNAPLTEIEVVEEAVGSQEDDVSGNHRDRRFRESKTA